MAQMSAIIYTLSNMFALQLAKECLTPALMTGLTALQFIFTFQIG